MSTRRAPKAAWVLVALGGLAAVVAGGVAPPKAPDGKTGAIRYSRDVRPILSDRCFQCHGPDASKREAKLRLDDPDSAKADHDGSFPIVAGKPDESELIARINSEDPEEQMPPPKAEKRPLTAEDKAVLKEWIAQGGKYEPHWAFVPPVKGAAPEVKGGDWCRGDIDRFVLANMERHGVSPSPEADRANLLRRVFLDLTGLPPTPEELDSFLADKAPDAYEREVDKLLTEEPYRTRTAERLAVPWLDAARYADTCGIHTDDGRQMWLWRDWVIDAYRDNMPYDKFLTEQLAGDLLPDATTADKIASGFNRNHVTSDEGGAINEEYLVEYAVDRVDTTSEVFLGLTMRCARCHDHKFDPITQKDFYSFLSFFNSIDEPGVYSQTQNPIRAYEPYIEAPTAAQQKEQAGLEGEIKEITDRLSKPFPGEDEQRVAFLRDTPKNAGVEWSVPEVVSAASSSDKEVLTKMADGSVQATGPVPDTASHTLVLKTDGKDLRLLLLEAMVPDGNKSAGRAFNQNGVVSSITLEQRPSGENGGEWKNVPLRWAWADHSQKNGDYESANVTLASTKQVWAIDGHRLTGERLLLMQTDEPFGGVGQGGETELRVTINYLSQYAGHTLGRVRLSVGTMKDSAASELPITLGRWYTVGPFPSDPAKAYDTEFGPEKAKTIDLSTNFGAGNQYWNFDERLVDGEPVALADTAGAIYVGREIWSPDARDLEVSLGSDDGFRLFVNGEEQASHKIERSLAPDQDKATLHLKAGANCLVMKIVNTGGNSGYYFRAMEPDGKLGGDLVEALLPPGALSAEQAGRLGAAWRMEAFPEFRKADARRAELQKKVGELEAAFPRAMVMKELPMPRETLVLTRGQYDHPDKSRPVTRAVPVALGKLPKGAPANRLGLAEWMTQPDNPLVARVEVNRLWEMIFGTGLVRTSEDFGQQGEWPTNDELLDWLAVDFREHGWDMRRMIRAMVTSSTYRQSSRVRTDLAEVDPENKLLAYYPRRRLGAEQIRDLALYTAGLLVEKAGGPSVKPYHPDGRMWKEIALPASNTQVYEQGTGEALWRRSMYTYWKRSCPPPSLQTLDAPTRESCVIKRPITNTPLQALVLWNDEQMVEAARVLAQRTLAASGDDAARLSVMFRRCTGRNPDEKELGALAGALGEFEKRYAAAPADAEALIKIGMAPLSKDIEPSRLAAWTMIANSVLNLHETITQD